jgi:hypothetical protein
MSANSTVSGTGFSTNMASPPDNGGTAAAAGTFTTLTSTGNTTIGDADTDTVVINGQFVTGTQIKSAKLTGNTLNLAAYDVDGVAYVQLVTLTASNTPTLALTSTGVGTINNMSIGATTASTGAFTTVSASSTTVTGNISGNVVSTDVIEIVGDSLINVTRSTDDKILISASAGTKVIENVDNSGDYVLDLFGSTVYRSAKYLYTAKTTAYLSGGPHFASGEILVMHDGANTYITQYALLSSSADDIVTVSTDINNSNVRLLARATLGGTLATVRLTGITYTEI